MKTRPSTIKATERRYEEFKILSPGKTEPVREEDLDVIIEALWIRKIRMNCVG